MNKIIDKIIADEASLESPEPFTSFGMAMVSLKRRIARRAYIAGLEAALEAANESKDEYGFAAMDISQLIFAAKEGT